MWNIKLLFVFGVIFLAGIILCFSVIRVLLSKLFCVVDRKKIRYRLRGGLIGMSVPTFFMFLSVWGVFWGLILNSPGIGYLCFYLLAFAFTPAVIISQESETFFSEMFKRWVGKNGESVGLLAGMIFGFILTYVLYLLIGFLIGWWIESVKQNQDESRPI